MVQKGSFGFTIIEMLIVVAILSILAAIAIPTYTKYKIQARRADGQVALVEAAQKMERYFTRNNTFDDASIGDSDGDLINSTSEKGYYALSFEGDGPDARSFTIKAEAQNEQAHDAECPVLRIDHLGRKEPEGCW